MKSTIFYCWQSDLPKSTNHTFIEKSLENVAKSLRKDDSITVEPDIDRDTKGVPGAPDIANTIFAKIRNADVFVCDISIINDESYFPEGLSQAKGLQTSPRPTPNPNVLIELGYALNVLPFSRVILVFNEAFGTLAQLPFDLMTKRVITYKMPLNLPAGGDRATERKRLESKLEFQLRAIFAEIEEQRAAERGQIPTIVDQTISAIEEVRPTQSAKIVDFFAWLLAELDKLAPHYDNIANNEYDEALVAALDETQQLILDFARVTRVLAMTNAREASLTLYKQFSKILIRYKPVRGFSGNYFRFAFDYYKFLGHEMLVIFFSFLLQEERWAIMTEIFEVDIIDEGASNSTQSLVGFTSLSEHVELLRYRNDRLKLNRVSLHADILNARHSKGNLHEHVPAKQFIEADYFLFLRAQLETPQPRRNWWRPWGALYLGYQTPEFLIKARRMKYAHQLLEPLGVSNIEALREGIGATKRTLGEIFGAWADVDPLIDFDVQQLGST